MDVFENANQLNEIEEYNNNFEIDQLPNEELSKYDIRFQADLKQVTNIKITIPFVFINYSVITDYFIVLLLDDIERVSDDICMQHKNISDEEKG